jgi:hypothetical protein
MKQFSFFLSILLFSPCTLPTAESTAPLQKSLEEKIIEGIGQTLKKKPTGPCLVTIFVHGTLKPAQVSLSTINDLMHNKIENTLYSITLEYMRANKYLHQNTATQGLGLVYINPLNEVCQSGAQTMKNLFELAHVFYKSEYTHRRYYTFGWNGLLNMKERYSEAERLYHALEKEVILLRSKGIEPHIHIIAYSHGGNVALNLAKIKEENITPPHFSIEQLVLLATPIQKETDYLVGDTSFFKKSYLFYSTEDQVQTSDFFSTQKELFSRRKFTSRIHFKLPTTLTQVRIRLTRRINRSKLLKNENATLEAILSDPHIRCLHMDPSHTEFWNLKWGNTWYRKSLPIAPLPVVAFVPSITYLLEHFAPEAQDITFDYCPSIGGARLITSKHKITTVVPVLNETVISHMNEIVKKCTPEDFSLEEQNRQEQLALKQAYETLKKDKKALKKKSRRKLMTSYLDLSRKMWPHQFPQF